MPHTSDKFMGLTGTQLEHVLTLIICAVVLIYAMRYLFSFATTWLNVKKEISFLEIDKQKSKMLQTILEQDRADLAGALDDIRPQSAPKPDKPEQNKNQIPDFEAV